MDVSMPNLKKAKINIFFGIMVILVIFNILALKSAVLGLILGILWLFLFVSGIFGAKFAPGKSNLAKNMGGLFGALILIICLSCLFFYLFNFNQTAIWLVFLIISALGLILIHKSKPKLEWQADIFKIQGKQLIAVLIYVILFILLLALLLLNQTSEAIRSPWEVLPVTFFIIYFLASGVLIKILINTGNHGRDKGLELILISMHLFLSLIIGVIIYKIGFGFDAFVHRAAEIKLAELGYILPKPLYYIGQYTLVVFLSKFLWVPIIWLDKLLVPVLAALMLPVAVYGSFGNWFKNKTLLLIATWLVLIIISPLFFYTVPQSLANLFLLVLIFGVIKKLVEQQKISNWYWLAVLAIFLIHPLAGIPAVILLAISQLVGKNKKILKTIYFAVGSLSISLFFLLASLISNFKVGLSFKSLANLGSLFNDLFSYLPFYSVYHLIYLYEYNRLIIFALILIAGGYYLIKTKKTKLLAMSCQMLVILLINLCLLGMLEFKSVIDYEQAEFVKRLGQIIVLFLLPLFLIGVYFFLSKIIRLKTGWWIILALTAAVSTISLYLAYPHTDAFNRERGYSVSSSDIKAVHLINLDGFDKDFVVLSNQSTAAASLQEFGFKKYYKCQIPDVNCQMLFYYPIPTSSPLYELYLKMVYDQPRIEYINQARQLTGVKRVYFVINDYWLDAKKRIEQASQIADLKINIDNRIWIFRFE